MNKILELEALRAIAAIYVFFHHTLFSFELIQKSSLLGKVFSFGQEAVMVFFLLSGYVIALSMEKNNYTFGEYFKHRFFRIYPIIIIAWVVSYVSFILLNQNPNPSLYDYLINVSMLQDISALKPGVFANPLFGNSPLWSLSYEWWFYMLFFFHFHFYQKYLKRNVFIFNLLAFLVSLIGLLSYNFIYNQISLIAMYYYIWFSGAMTLILFKNNQLTKLYILMVTLSYLSIIVAYFFLFIYHRSNDGIGVHPLLELRHYTVAFLGLLAALFFSKYLYHYCIKKTFYNKFVQLSSHVAPISFGIYILHYPIKNYFMHYTHTNPYLLISSTLVLTILLSYLAEVKLYGYIKRKIQ